MMTTTLDRLRGLRLSAMADAYLIQHQDGPTPSLGFDERFSMLVDAEHLFRHNRALTRRLKEAKLRIPQACLEDLDPSPRRGLERTLVRQLTTKGEIPCRRIGRLVRYTQADIDAFVDSRENHAL